MVFLGKQGGRNDSFSIAKFFQPKSILLLTFILVAVVAMYFCVPFFHNSIARIVGSGSDYTNAIAGRVSSGNKLISQMSGLPLLIGTEDGLTGIKFNMSGFNETMYQYGIVGILISYIFYLQGIFRLKKEYFWLTLIIIALSFFSSHTHSTMFMLYSAFVFVDGYQDKKRREISRSV